MKSPVSRRDFLRTAALAPVAAPAAISGRSRQDVIREEARAVPVVETCDICVVGGSSTGVFAAVAAARLGARVAIIEWNGFFGGVATASLVNVWHSTSDTTGKRPIIAGLTAEVLDRLRRRGGLIERGSASVGYYLNTEELKIELDALVTEARIRPFLHALFVSPFLEGGEVAAAVIEDKSGRRAIRASYFIDATGDADLVARSGLPVYRRDSVQPPTTCAILRGLGRIRERNPDFSVNRAIFDSRYPTALPRGFSWSAPVPGSLDDTMLAGTRIFGADLSDADQLTRAEMEGRRQVRAVCDTLRKNFLEDGLVPLAALPTRIGIRETRHGRCLHTLTQEEVLRGTRFPDAIANGCYRVDIHASHKEGIIFRYLDGTEVIAGADGTRKTGRWRDPIPNPPTFYQVPYRSLVPRGSRNVLLAGRCLDADEGAFGAVRVMVNCNQMGQAAGTACALALRSKAPVSDVDPRELRETLRTQGALVI